LYLACYRGYDQQEEEASYSRITCVKLLVETGADVNFVKKKTKLTALHWAAYNNDKIVVSFLMKHGA
jgi:ankyrin repeat protein